MGEPGHGFDSAGRHLEVDRVGRRWRLRHNGTVVETRDLPGGVDQVLGKAPDNLELVLRILESDVDTRTRPPAVDGAEAGPDQILLDELRAAQSRSGGAAAARLVRLERDLHDGVMQRLLGLQLGLRRAREQTIDKECAAELSQLEEEAGRIGGDIRTLSHGIYPAILVERGVIAALKEATTASAHRVTVEGAVARLTPDAEQALYYCILEAVQNVLRHGGTWAKAHVVLETHSGRVWFSVADDGVGFDPESARRGKGLHNMCDRILLAAGEIAIDSSRGHGAHVHGYVTQRPVA